MFDAASGHSEFFEEELTSTLVKQGQINGAENGITEAERMPVVVSRHLRSSMMKDRRRLLCLTAMVHEHR